ncbi:hypothetical protein BGZ46_000915 [Entomortierella lignicola]|nr:hypothetical protein BGZ46_000915 [Entomortierella lignicola]
MSGNESQPGITPRAVEDIFKYIRENSDREFLLRVSYLEIYNETIRDLLSPEAIDLRIHEDKRMHTLDLSVHPVTSTLKMLASLLERITTANDKIKQALPDPETPLVMTPAQHQIHTSFTRFHARSIPSISINAYLTRILKYCPCANECFLSLLVYFDRMARNVEEITGGEGRQFSIDSYNIHRLIIAGIMVSAKYFSDVFFTNSRYAKVGGLPVSELNQLEVEFLTLNNFALAISIEELQTYGDQLMKHWMCEEVANRDPEDERPSPAVPAALSTQDQQDGESTQDGAGQTEQQLQDRGVYVSPLKEEIVTTPNQVMRIIERGDYQRHVSSTDFNAHSSRSHSIFQIVIESRDRSPGSSNGGSPTSRKPLGAKSVTAVRVSQLNLIDLAGSEKAASNEERRKEGAFINKSLLTLGTVISKLTEERGAHIPYRDSKLTRILQSSLNGNARVSVIATISPSSLNVEESNNTLKFAARVKKVVTKAQTNQVMDDKALLEKYRREISELKAQLMLTASGEASGAGGSASTAASGKQAELSTLLEKERMKHEEEMVEMSLVRNALKERIDHLTKLILTSQSINTKATAPEFPAARYTVETSADGTSLEFPKELESRLAHKDAIVKQLESEIEAQNEKMALMKAALEKTSKGEAVDIEKTLAKVEQDLPRQKLLSEKRASIASIYALEQAGGANSNDVAALQALQRKKGDNQQRTSWADGEDEDDEDLRDTPWNQEELKSLRQAKRELEIIVIEQEKKIEDMVAFEDSDDFRDLVFELQEHKEKIMSMEEEREKHRVAITDLKNTIRKLELRQSTPADSSAATSIGGMTTAGSSTHNLAIAAAKIKELEVFAQKERRLRMDEQNRNMARIASLEAELTMMKAELSVRNLAAYS